MRTGICSLPDKYGGNRNKILDTAGPVCYAVKGLKTMPKTAGVGRDRHKDNRLPRKEFTASDAFLSLTERLF